MSFDLKTAIGSIAPTLATMLGGPLAGAAVSALTQAFGLSPSAGIDDVTKIVQSGQMTPEIIASVRASDQKHAEIIGQQGIDLVKLNADHDSAIAATEAGDRDSARKANVSGGMQGYIFALSLVLLNMTLGSEIYIMFKGLPVGLSDIVTGRVLGLMDAAAMMVLTYWYGTSHSSSVKDGTIANQQNPR